jgi:hypothetical protein
MVRRRARNFYQLRAHVRQNFPSYCNSFETAARKLGHDAARVDAAYFDILFHLLDGDVSGGIERSWEELSEDELRRYLDYGIRRELIRLTRSPNAQRAQELAEAKKG